MTSIQSFRQRIVVRGGGEIATGVVQKFFRAGFSVVVLETATPSAVRRSVSLCEAVYDAFAMVEDLTCRRVAGSTELEKCWDVGEVPLLIDPRGDAIPEIKPEAVIDAIIAKRNMGTRMDMAAVTIALGPGFCAGEDVQAVIETMPGHDLGRLILQGYAKAVADPKSVQNETRFQGVMHAPVSGTVRQVKQIGEVVARGEIVLFVDETPVKAPIRGLLRGMTRESAGVTKGRKIADIEADASVDWRTISDQARCVGGSALEAYLYLANRR